MFLTKEEYTKMYAESLAHELKKHGIKQRQLAEVTGLSESTVSRIVSGERLPNAYIAYKIAVATQELVAGIYEKAMREQIKEFN